MAVLNLKNSHLGDRHHERLRQRQKAAAEVPDWELLDVLPDRICAPQREELRRGVRVVEMPRRRSERRGTFLRWRWHKQLKQYAPVIRWDGDAGVSFSRLEILELESTQLTVIDMTQIPSEKPDSLRAECIALINRIARSPYNVKLLKSAKAALQLVAGYKSGRQSLSDRTPPR